MPEYDDDLYTKASTELIVNIESGIEQLREAGLSDEEIAGEVKAGFENAQFDFPVG